MVKCKFCGEDMYMEREGDGFVCFHCGSMLGFGHNVTTDKTKEDILCIR